MKFFAVNTHGFYMHVLTKKNKFTSAYCSTLHIILFKLHMLEY